MEEDFHMPLTQFHQLFTSLPYMINVHSLFTHIYTHHPHPTHTLHSPTYTHAPTPTPCPHPISHTTNVIHITYTTYYTHSKHTPHILHTQHTTSTLFFEISTLFFLPISHILRPSQNGVFCFEN